MKNIKITHTGAAFYATSALAGRGHIDHICIQDEHNREVNIEWVYIDSMPQPKLTAFDDSWSMLFENPELLEALSELDKKAPSAQQLKEHLLSKGATDHTLYEPR